MRPIPEQCRRVHLMPYWLGDSRWALATAAKTTKHVDLNVQDAIDGPVFLHWRTPARNGYRYIVRKGTRTRRPMTRAELNRPIDEWTVEQVTRWRQTPRIGRTRKSRVRPLTFAEGCRIAARKDVAICAELKSLRAARAFGGDMVITAGTTRATVYFMTLQSMPHWGAKLQAMKKVGGQTALLARGRKPAEFAFWSPWIDRVWGRWRS